MIYLDHSATTPVDKRVADKVYEAMLKNWGNPSSKYEKGNEAKIELEKARESVANLIGASASEIFFTSGGTEADNLALFGIMRQARKNGKGDHFITSSFEHSAILKAADKLEEEGFKVTRLPINKDGFVTAEVLLEAITEKTVLVSVMHINNELGTIQDIKSLGRICKEKGILFHSDAVQSFGKVAIDVNDMNLDLVSMSSHKIYGPKGVGAIYIRSGVDIEPVTRGGGQEKNIRTGTENMPGIIGFGEAVRICSEEIKSENSKLEELKKFLFEKIKENVEGEVLLNGSLENRLGANLNIAFPEVEGESMLIALNMDGIAVSTGSACSSGSTKPSHVLTSIGLSDQLAQSSLRLTLGRSSTREELEKVAVRIGYHVNRLRSMAF